MESPFFKNLALHNIKSLNSFCSSPAGFLLLDILTIFEPLNSDREEGLGEVVI